jgi:DNA-directed RNA polymerase sigma subunit (sigma70/sigma32)
MTQTKSAVDTWMDNAGRYPLLCETDTLRLARKAQNPDISDRERRRALDRLCLHNLRLVVKTVQNTINKTSLRWHDEIVADLLQQGYLGLRRAAEKFDTTKKIRFSTYATIWINQSVGRFKAAQQSMMKVPEKVMFQVWHFQKTGQFKTDCKEPISPAQAAEAARAMYTSSLDVRVKDDSDSTLSDMVSTQNRLGFESADNSAAIQRVQDLLGKAEVEPKVQKMFLTYMRTGNLQMSCTKAGHPHQGARKVVNATVAKLQALA